MKNNFEDFFSENNFDIQEPNKNHETRFLEKIQPKKQKSGFSWKWMSIAASIILLIGFKLGSYQQQKQYDLASISPKMKETQLFFIATLHQEINTIEKYRTIETESIIEDALNKIEELEDAYESFKLELKTQENERRIIQRMITNYQQRLNVLENLLLQLESLKNNLKKEFIPDEII